MLLAACAKEKAGSTEVEASMRTAKENAGYNASVFIASSPALSGFIAIPATDSSIKKTCPSGDGWATVEVQKFENNLIVSQGKIKCSTTSAALGCYTEEDFGSKPDLKTQEKSCNDNLDFPIEKIKQ